MEERRYRAYLCGGPNCGPKGSLELLTYLKEEVVRAGLAGRVEVAATGCQAHCESGVTMVVYPGRVFYQQMDRMRLQRIIAEHFQAGEPVKEYFWSGIRRRIIPGGAARQGKPQPAPQQFRREELRRSQSAKPKRSYEEVDDFKW
ncbi:MAG: (2Fe-2S) ferredoxin domain-containing protein [Chloroflexi bacterium]|nr:(2Fe-2S) ferredoxin domain-containing protein [Chloroflexota bacterium]